MQFPFRIVESKMSSRKEFDVTVGTQPTHALFYLKKGSFNIEICGAKENILAGDCLILPDYLHFKRNVIEPIEFLFIKFTNNMNCPYSLEIPYGKIALKTDGGRERLASNISAIEQSLVCDDVFSVNYREHLLIDILFQIASRPQNMSIATEHDLPHNPLVASAIEYIRNNIDKKLLIEDVCHAVCSNGSTLNFNFRRELDTSVNQFIMSERMRRARSLLVGTTYSISQIAEKCGFDNVYYFSNVFKKAYGVSPNKYRSHFH